MPSLLETVTSLLRQGENLERLGEMLGTDARRASNLVDVVTPVAITGLADRAFEPGGSDVVVRLLDGIDPSIVDNPLVFVERGEATVAEGLLLSIFADQHAALIAGLAEEGNVTEPMISRLLPGILALAIGVLGRRRAVRGVDEAGVLELLTAEKSVLPAERTRIPAMAGAAAAMAGTAVSGVTTETVQPSAAPVGGVDVADQPATTSSTADSTGIERETSAPGDPGEPPDTTTTAGGRDGRGPLLAIVGGLVVVVLSAWTLSQIGAGDRDDIALVDQPADDGGGDEGDEGGPGLDATSTDTTGNGSQAVDPAGGEDDGPAELDPRAGDGAVEAGDETDEPVTINEELSLDPITFEVRSATITAEGLAVLDVAADYLRADPELTIEIAGHTDSDGDAADNMRLSQDRADVVKAYLESRGIDGTRMTPVGYGENNPVASNDTDEGKAQNRRIEFVIQ